MAIELHDNLKILTNKPEIAFQYQDDASTPWSSIAGAHNGVPEAYRAKGKIRFIDQGDGKGVIEYWYSGGIELENLVPRYENLESAAAYVETLEGIRSQVETLKSETEEFKEQSLNAAQAAIEGIGTFNATTGIATIKESGVTFTPVLLANQPNGKFFDIDAPGTINITGTSIPVLQGGRLISRGTKWDYIPPNDTGYEKVVNLEKSLPKNAFKDIWLFPFLTISKRLLGGFEIDGSWNALKYKIQSIPGSALKNAEITYDKLHANVTSAFARVADLLPYEAAKNRFPTNPNPADYAFPFTDKNGRLLGYIQHDGTFVFMKFKYSLSVLTQLLTGTFAKNSDLTPYEIAKNRFPVNPNPTDYAFPFTDKGGRLLGYIQHDGTFVFLKFKYSLSGMLPVLAPIFQPLAGKKLVTLGDSITRNSNWQPLLASLTGMVWSREETRRETPVNNPYIPPMGVGGSKCVPTIEVDAQNPTLPDGSPNYEPGRGPGQSIFVRAGFVHLNNPDVIVVWGGPNDSLTESTWGSPTDAPYTGGELQAGDPNTPTFCAAYNGVLKKVIDNNPGKKIFVKTRLYATNVNENNELAYQKLISFNNLIRGCAERQGIPVIDVFKESGIWSHNASTLIPDGVHPSDLGAIRIAQMDAKRIY